MGAEDEQDRPTKPSEQRGGTTPGPDEAAEKGPWAAKAAEGVVPAELGGSDAPPELQDEDPELGGSVLGETTGSDEPATEEGVDPGGGEHADATSDGAPEGAVTAGDEAEPSREREPDLKDAALGPRQSDIKSAE
jgi:hypothetical protein